MKKPEENTSGFLLIIRQFLLDLEQKKSGCEREEGGLSRILKQEVRRTKTVPDTSFSLSFCVTAA